MPAPPRTGSIQSLHLIVNPRAAKGKAERILPRILRDLERASIPHTVSTTKYPRHATELVRALDGRQTAQVAVGGDGTVNEVVNGMSGTGHTLGVIPAGTGDDFARLVGMRGHADLIRAVADSRVMQADLGEILFRTARGEERRHLFANTMGIGFDAVVALGVLRSRFGSGILPYLFALLRALARYEPVPARVTAEETSFAAKLFLATAGNGTTSGGGFVLSPRARLDDGLLDLCFVREISLRRVVRLLPKTFSGTHLGQPEVAYLRAREIHIELDRPLPLHADGEIITEEAVAVTARIRPSGLSVLHNPV